MELKNMIEMKNKDLQNLLKKTQRMANIAGKDIPQVVSCVIQQAGEDNGRAVTCSIVRDGITSVASFGVPCEPSEGAKRIIVPNIELLLGVLKHHRDSVRLVQDENKLRVSSSGKQTTLSADKRAKAFPHSQETVESWFEKSVQRRGQFLLPLGEYKTGDGENIGATDTLTFECADLRDALSVGFANGQKCPHFVMDESENDYIEVSIGDTMKGLTNTQIPTLGGLSEGIIVEASGLENTLALCSGATPITAYVFDFRPLGAKGGLLVLDIRGEGIVLQRVKYVSE
jgi:hypothetical protein